MVERMTADMLYARFNRFFRRARMAEFIRRFEVTDKTRILDVGGTKANWRLVSLRPRVTLINLDSSQSDLVGDGCRLPFRDVEFDIVYSNSVIEHVGDRPRQYLFAAECRRVGRRYYIQTPNYYFPIEPHMLAPFIHWLPAPLRDPLVPLTPAALLRSRSEDNVADILRSTRLLCARQMREMFPDSELWRERFMGMSKSLIAVRL